MTTTEPESLGVFGEADDEELADFAKPPIPFTLVAYERIVEYPDPDDDIADAEVVDELTEGDLGDPAGAAPSSDDDAAVERLPAPTGPLVRHEPREFTFHVWAEVEFGPLFRALSGADSKGSIPPALACQFLADAIVPEERARFDEVIRNYRVKASLIQQLAEALAERYGMRPTQSRSERRNRPRQHGRTTEVAHSGRVSTSTGPAL